MADEDLPQSAAAAVAEAGRAVKDAPPAEIAAHLRGETPEPDPEQGSPEPAATPEADTHESEPDPGSDYNPEDQAVYPDDDKREGGEQPATAAPEAPSGWSDEDKKLWEDFKASRRQPATEPEPTPAPQDEAIRDTVARLIESDPTVARKVSDLEPLRESFLKLQTEAVPQHEEAVSKVNTELTTLRGRLEYAKELAEQDPDDLIAGERYQTLRGLVQEKQLELNEARYNLREVRDQFSEASRQYQGGLKELRDIGLREQQRVRESTEVERVKTQEEQRALREWDAALPKVLGKYGFTNPADREVIEEMLAEAVDALEAQGAEAPENLEAWIDSKVARQARLAGRVRGRETEANADLKRRVADTGVPTGRAAVAEERRPERLSSRDEHARAARQLRKELSRSA